MKTFALVIFAVVLLSLPTAAAAQGIGCVTVGSPPTPTGMRDDNIYYTDCFPWDTPDGTISASPSAVHNDTPRLQRAIDAAQGSKLIFNEPGYYIDGQLDLRSYSVLEGLSASSDNILGLRIVQTASTSVTLSIGEGIHNVAIRDLGFYYDDVTTGGVQRPADATAIMAEGAPGHDNSTYFVFENLRIRNFTKGVYVHSTGAGGWQFDNNQLKDSTFEECGTAILLDAINTGWNMNNIGFASLPANGKLLLPAQDGLVVKNAGYLNINLMVGNGTYVGDDPAAGTFISIEKHGFVNIQNSNGEAYKHELNIDTPFGRDAPIVLINNDFHDCQYTEDHVVHPSVYINNASVVSQGNNYACVGKVARPRVEGWSEVYSSGDRFCDDGESTCFDKDLPFDETLRSGWDVRGNFATIRTDFRNTAYNTGPTSQVFDMNKAFVDITSGYSYDSKDPVYKPFLSFTNSFYDVGTAPYYFKYRYSFARNVQNGRLEVTGDFNGGDLRGDPQTHMTGFHFKGGPVQLWSVAAADLTDYNSYSGGDAGSVLYCSDCTAGTNPCSTAGGGGGALAIKVQSGNWACK